MEVPLKLLHCIENTARLFRSPHRVYVFSEIPAIPPQVNEPHSDPKTEDQMAI